MKDPAGRALIVEDDRSWRQILSEILTDAGLTVDVADSFNEAAACLQAFPHRLAVIDLSLGHTTFPNQDGLRVLDAVRRMDPGCTALLLIGYATVELAVIALRKHGAFTCLRKEAFDRALFRELVDRALASAPPLAAAPVDRQAAPALVEATVEAEAGVLQETGPPIRALVVEDDAGWRGILSELLADAGFSVRLCRSFGEAIGRLRREAYALAVVDLSLEGAGVEGPRLRDGGASGQDTEGYRLLERTRAAGIPTIVVSGVATPIDIERAFAERGIFAFLEKQSFDRRAFVETVGEVRAKLSPGGELARLTRREGEVLALVAQGKTNKEIAQELYITTNTVKRHLKAVFRKLDVHTRSAAAAKAVDAGLAR